MLAVGLLTIPAIPEVSDLLMAPLERGYPARRAADYPNADAIVILGGSVPAVKPPRVEAEETGGARVFTGARLFRLGKAPILHVTGGGEYIGPDGEPRTEARDMTEVLSAFGIPAERVSREDQSRTTLENAQHSAPILKAKGVRSILLVTSAFHLRRAVPLFEQHGFEVIAVPTGHIIVESTPSLSRWLPNAEAMQRSTIALKEYGGDLVSWCLTWFRNEPAAKPMPAPAG
jgi:uncharacterized SAM-binding protein YcdF (DUF218 family)